MSETARLLQLDSAAYHADNLGDTPTLSASLAHVLCTSSPRHAWTAHPKLNPHFERAEEEKFDVGTVAHAMLLQGDDIAEALDFPDWRTKASQAARDDARVAGRVPLLTKDYDRVRRMVDAARAKLAAHAAVPPLLTDGKPEQTLVWEEEGGVVCRARLDWLRDDLTAIDDLKTTARTAEPEAWSRSTLWSIGADVQIAFYLRGLQALTGRSDVQFRYVIVETQPPHELSVIAPGPDVLTLGRKKVEWAIRRWRRCLRDGVWPGYPTEICWAEMPPWEENRWLEREVRDAA